jgi:hypothetical protein
MAWKAARELDLCEVNLEELARTVSDSATADQRGKARRTESPTGTLALIAGLRGSRAP